MRHETMKHYSHSDRRDNLDNYGNYLLETDTTRVYIGNKLNFGSCVSLSSIYQFIVRLSYAWQCKLTFLSTPTTNICIYNHILCKYVTSRHKIHAPAFFVYLTTTTDGIQNNMSL